MRIHALIPARLESTRLPRKLLLNETGHSLIWHTAKSARASGLFDSIRVIADSREIIQSLKGRFAFDVTPADTICRNGTERIAEHVLRNPNPDPYLDGDLFVNIQADEPCLQPWHFEALLDRWDECPAADVVTLVRPLKESERADRNTVKAFLDLDQSVFDFDREWSTNLCEPAHIGVYAFTRRYLQWYVNEPPSSREKAEGLEQLRLKTVRFYAAEITDYDGVSVNTAEDYQRFVEWYRSRRAHD